MTALSLLLAGELRELPVVSEDGRIIGFLDEAEITNAYHGDLVDGEDVVASRRIPWSAWRVSRASSRRLATDCCADVTSSRRPHFLGWGGRCPEIRSRCTRCVFECPLPLLRYASSSWLVVAYDKSAPALITLRA